MSDITKCPVRGCGGLLEATVKHYTTGVVIRLRPEGTSIEIVDEGDLALTPAVEAIYCESDHTEAQIIAALKEATP